MAAAGKAAPPCPCSRFSRGASASRKPPQAALSCDLGPHDLSPRGSQPSLTQPRCQPGSLGPHFTVNTQVSSLQHCTLTQGQSRLRDPGSGTRGSDRAEGDRHLQPPSNCNASLLPRHPCLGSASPRPACPGPISPAPLHQGCWGCSHTPPLGSSLVALCPHPTGPKRQRAGSAGGPPHAPSASGAEQTLDKGSKLRRGRVARRDPGGTQRRGLPGTMPGGPGLSRPQTSRWAEHSLTPRQEVLDVGAAQGCSLRMQGHTKVRARAWSPPPAHRRGPFPP